MPQIVIVGAGIAGLTAALTLRDAGLACSIYEASNRIGGRIHSNTKTWTDSMVSEWCGEFIDQSHQTIHRLIKRFGLHTVDLGQKEADQSEAIFYFFNRYYRPQELTGDWSVLAPLLQEQMQEVGFPTTYNQFTTTGARLDGLSAYDWIEQYLEGGHNTPLGHLMDAACTGFYGLDAQELSSLNLIYLFGAPVAEGSLPASQPMQTSSKIRGGNAQLPLALAATLPQESIFLDHQLVALERHDDQSLTLTFKTANGFLDVQCDSVILTLPFSTLRSVDYRRAGFDVLKQTAIEQLGYGTISKLFLQFDQPYWNIEGSWPYPHRSFVVTDLDAQTVWDASLGQTGSSGLLVNYTSGQRGAAYTPKTAYSTTDDEPLIQSYASNCLHQLEHVFPGISAHYINKAALSYPTGDPYLLGSYACWRVGQYTRFAGYEGVRQGPIHFAGEHCSIEFQGFMEGAAREGVRAAQEIVQDMQ